MAVFTFVLAQSNAMGQGREGEHRHDLLVYPESEAEVAK
jgi:hypothetical protein